jgi:hypothetical protein
MFTSNQPHREWEMAQGAQRKFIIGVVVAAGFVGLMNLLAGTGPSPWGQLQPSEVAHRLQLAAR